MTALHDPHLLTRDAEMSALLSALSAFKHGKTGIRLPLNWSGTAGKVADAFNEVVEQNERIVGRAGPPQPAGR